MAAALTLTAAAPSTLHQILKPSRRGMLYAMACSSLAFFFFPTRCTRSRSCCLCCPCRCWRWMMGGAKEGV